VGKLYIHILGAHTCESKNSKLVTLLVDNILALDAGGLTSSLSFENQLKLKAVLLTHQHYDHIRDIPAIAMNALLHETTINVYSTSAVRDALADHLLNGGLYPDFLNMPEANPTLKFTQVESHQAVSIEDYRILPVPVHHSTSSVGYQVTSPDGKTIFYTGDAGPDLAECWQQVSPQLLVIEVTSPNRWEEFARRVGHLTPNLLSQELESFREIKGYLPQAVTIHMNPIKEKEIEAEIAEVARSLDHPITLAHEEMIIDL
jgi:ribonuclease BN (tRNA processing enzyme)